MKWLKRFFSRKKDVASDTAVVPPKTPATGSLLYLKREKFRDLPLKEYFPYLLVSLIALMAADLTTTAIRSYMIPNAAPPAQKQSVPIAPYKSRGDYNDILARNVFNSDGVIPDLQVAEGGGNVDTSGPARESTLPLVLMGTIVHANPGKSVATIQANGNAEKVLPYIPNDDIEGLATLIKVTRKKAFIRNLSSGSLEYIQIKEESAFTFQRKTPAAGDGPIQKEGDDMFSITRSALEGHMNNLPELLTQARAVPNIVPGSGGRVDGFKVIDIQENSLFRTLGIQPGDVIKGVDGEPLDSPAKAMELYNGLRNKSDLRLQVERNGRSMTMTYKIR